MHMLHAHIKVDNVARYKYMFIHVWLNVLKFQCKWAL